MISEYHIYIAVALFVLTYIFLISEKFHKTTVALLGAALLIVTGVLTQEEAIRYIDFNTLGLLLGMMILVSITSQTGLFEYLAIKLAKLAKGSPTRILINFMAITALLSALLDNVTTVIVIIPITVYICRTIKINPIGLVIGEIFASNIGGTATLIGDPPNIIIGSAANLAFSDFIIKLAPISIITLVVVIYLFKIIYKNDLKIKGYSEDIMKLDEREMIKNKPLLIKSIAVLFTVIIAFFMHGMLHLSSATIAVAGACVLLAFSNVDIKEVFSEVEWTTILFFTGLFILVGGLEKTGVLEQLARYSFEATGGNILLTGISILWISAVLSACVDNIPFVATMIPMIKSFGALSGAHDVNFLWWCLALGACFGGNGTIIGASANVLGIDIMKNEGYDISFKGYFKIAFPLMLLTIIIATIYCVLVLY